MAPTPERHSPSAARSLSALEVKSLSALAAGLPDSWVIRLEPPHGQLAMTPVAGMHRFHRCWVASGKLRRIFRDSGLSI